MHMHNDRVFNYMLEHYFYKWNPGGWVAFREGMEEILGDRASTFLVAIGKTQPVQQGTSQKADFVNGFLPAHVVVATALSRSVPGLL